MIRSKSIQVCILLTLFSTQVLAQESRTEVGGWSVGTSVDELSRKTMAFAMLSDKGREGGAIVVRCTTSDNVEFTVFSPKYIGGESTTVITRIDEQEPETNRRWLVWGSSKNMVSPSARSNTNVEWINKLMGASEFVARIYDYDSDPAATLSFDLSDMRPAILPVVKKCAQHFGYDDAWLAETESMLASIGAEGIESQNVEENDPDLQQAMLKELVTKLTLHFALNDSLSKEKYLEMLSEDLKKYIQSIGN